MKSRDSRALARGFQLHQSGRLAEAEAMYRQVLAADPANAQALHLLGALANQTGQPAAAVDLFLQSIRSDPSSASVHSNLGVAYQNLGRLEEAVAAYERALVLQPTHVDALNNLGVALQALGRLDGALSSFERSLKLRPNHAETTSNVGALYLALGRLDEAEARLRRALRLKPGHAEALTNLGGVLVQRGRLDEALAACDRAIGLAPEDARAHDMRGTVLRASRRADEAIASYERALALGGDGPQSANRWLNLAGTLQQAGRTADAAAAYREALARNPDSAVARSGLIFALDLLPGMLPEARAERRRWNARFGGVWQDRPARHPNHADPDRPLRVGYVSADFYHHSAASVFMPILRMHDRDRVQVYCYSGATTADAITEEARALAVGWRDVAYLSDDALEAQIRADEIDVLVDLSGHSAGNRLPVFARKPAPIQVTAWGYATGTGLDAMDAFLIDRVVVPPQEDGDYAEQIVALPSPICFEPPSDLPPVVPLPARTRGFVTFGTFNRLPKVSPGAIDAWVRVLLAVPDSRLLVKSGGQDAESARQGLVDELVARGVARERVTVLGKTSRLEHLALHGEVDLILDTFPHTGGVTTVEALLMGVPVVTLLGEGVAGRLSASFLTALGLEDLVAETADAYVGLAARLAGDLDWLERERGTLRARLLASPICNSRAYTRAVEAAYRGLWRQWCGVDDVGSPTPSPSPLRWRGESDVVRSSAADAVPVTFSPLHRSGEGLGVGLPRNPTVDARRSPATNLRQRGIEAFAAGNVAAAADCFAQIVAQEPQDADAWCNLGAAQIHLGQYPAAEASLRRAVQLRPAFGDALNNLGNVLVAQSRWDEAAPVLEQAVRVLPDAANGWINLGHALKGQERHDAAVAAYERALSLRPGDTAALRGLGDALQGLGQLPRAIGCYERALAGSPRDPDTYEHLEIAIQRLGHSAPDQGDDGRAAPESPSAALARLAVAIRNVLADNPDLPLTHSYLIVLLDVMSGAEAEANAERCRWNARFGGQARGVRPLHTNDRRAGRPLRVGYVSADFRHHSAAYLILPVLRAHDRSRVQVYCYSGVTAPDVVTEQFRGLADVWRETARLSDDELEATIRHDEIDVLVDLSGHTRANRLTVFARQPAPVQLTAWGYATGTGLDTMGYFLADPVVVPAEARAEYAEEVVDLPNVVCFEPPSVAPSVAPPPALVRGRLTFGAFNRLPKVSDRAIQTWSRVLEAVPGSTLIVKSAGLEDAVECRRLLDRFAACRIGPERLSLRPATPHAEHLAEHAEIDVMLDSFPHTGGVTTLDSLLMGVPVVTLLGEGVAGRLSASFLTALGLGDLIAETTDRYVEIAAHLAADLSRLERERATLRDRLLASPMGDAVAYTRAVEAVYHRLWQRWLDAQPVPRRPVARAVAGGPARVVRRVNRAR